MSHLNGARQRLEEDVTAEVKRQLSALCSDADDYIDIHISGGCNAEDPFIIEATKHTKKKKLTISDIEALLGCEIEIVEEIDDEM